MKNKTWNEFWGEFLQITFHEGHPDLWPTRERKAIWASQHFKLPLNAAILDLGCGDGILDIWLSRMGFNVTAVDRNLNVLEKAKITDNTKKVKYLFADLKDVQFAPQSFDAVIFIEALGLMSKKAERQLFEKIYSWLKPNGKFILDSPNLVDLKNSWTKEFPIGLARGVSSFDPITRVQDIQFYFTPKNEEEFGIYDPYDIEKGDVPGIRRYLYPEIELAEVLKKVGFKTQKIDHYYEKNYFGLLAEKN